MLMATFYPFGSGSRVSAFRTGASGMILGAGLTSTQERMYNTEYISAIRQFMVNNNQTVAVAESVTAGHLQAAISLAIEASKFFQGGITAYNLGQKSRHLHVNPIHATSCNSVSQIVAEEMARNVIPLFSCDWSIGITGYASPMPDMGIVDLFAFYAVCFRGDIVHKAKIKSDDLGPFKVQVHFTNEVLKGFFEYLPADGLAFQKPYSKKGRG